jgi:transcriptional regulator with GAF, ATPase, and Fis domain
LAVESDYLKVPAVADLVKLGRIRTMLIVPMLMSKATVIGAITVSKTRVQPFTEKEIEMVADFAAQATIALETTRRERQYREVQMHLAHANRVATIGQLSASIAHEPSSRLAQWSPTVVPLCVGSRETNLKSRKQNKLLSASLKTPIERAKFSAGFIAL